jgi:DGQHR domain-containing protein
MRIDVTRATQDRIAIYCGVLPARTLLDRAAVDEWSKDHEVGYQRGLSSSRIKQVVHYLEEADGVFPTSVLLSYRVPDKTVFHPKAPQSEDAIQAGMLELLDPEQPLWVIDGQHRLRALEVAMAEDQDRWGRYPVPFTLLVNDDVFEEARWFYVVNSKAKRVPVDLAEQLLARAADVKGEDWLRRSEAPLTSSVGDKVVIQTRLVRLVDYLEKNCPVWTGHVLTPGENKGSNEDVKHHQLVTSLSRGAATDRGFLRVLDQSPVKLGEFLGNFWEAVAQRWPAAISDGKEFTLRRTQGLYAMHALFPDVLEICRENQEYGTDHILKLLEQIEVGDDFWSRDPDLGHPLTQATSMATLRRLAHYLRDFLPEVALPGF